MTWHCEQWAQGEKNRATQLLKFFWENPKNPHHSEIRDNVLILTVLQLSMKSWYHILRSFNCLNLTEKCSMLIFCHWNLIMRKYFTDVAITDQDWFHFWTFMIVHSAWTINEISKHCKSWASPKYLEPQPFNDLIYFSARGTW